MTGRRHSGNRAYSQRTAEKMIRDAAIQNTYKDKKILITWKTGYMIYNYADLFIRPKGVRQRDHDRFVSKIIDFANKHGGWQLIDDDSKYNRDVIVEGSPS